MAIKLPFDSQTFLSIVGRGKKTLKSKKNAVLFTQGDAADAVFYITAGKVKLTVVSSHGKEAVVGILGEANFFGEGCLAGQPLRMATEFQWAIPPSSASARPR